MDTIIRQALIHTVTDIGQLSAEDKRELSKAVRRGWLSKGKGGPYPALKTVYAFPGFPFAEHRQAQIGGHLHGVSR